MNFFENNLMTISSSLTMDHLGLAYDAYYRIKTDKRSKGAISTILHSYCGLESAVNLIGFEMFFNKESNKYVNESKRDMLLRRFLKSWNQSISCLDKIDYILSINNDKFEGRLRNELIELNNLRNWIAHGFPYKVTYLVQPDDEDSSKGTVIDFEYDVDWKKKFPQTKFNALNALNEEDAEKAFRIVVAVLINLSSATGEVFSLLTYSSQPYFRMITKDTNIDELLKI